MEMTGSSCCCLEICPVFYRSPNACRICWLTTGLGSELFYALSRRTCLDDPQSAGVRLSVHISKLSTSSNTLIKSRESTQSFV